MAALLAAACGATSSETLTGPGPAKCPVTLAVTEATLAAEGGTGGITVTTQPECAWTAASEAGWLTDVDPTRGQGTGQIQFRATANPNGTARESAVVVNDQRAVVRQSAAPCNISLSTSAGNFGAGGGAATIAISVPPGCAWSAASSVGWINISPDQGTGPGTVNLTVAANTGPARSGAVTIGGEAATFTQDGVGTAPPAACAASIQPTTLSIGSAGGPTTVAVTASASCTWTATTTASWITITAPATRTGSGSLGLTVAPNTAAATRTGTVAIAGTTLTINQAAAASCNVTINPTSQSVGAGGVTGFNVSVSAASSCAWTATSNASWITITSGASGTGNGTVRLNAAANQDSARSGTVTIGSQTFTFNQASGCGYSINPTSQSIGAVGGAGSNVAVSTGSSCTWSATSNASWLTITSGAAGTGNGSVTFTAAPNLGQSRTGTLTIATQTFTVNQSAACTYTLKPTSVSVDGDADNTRTVSVSAPSLCPWTAVSNVSWLTITSGAVGTGNGTVEYSIAALPQGTNNRVGTLTIAGQTFTVTQKK